MERKIPELTFDNYFEISEKYWDEIFAADLARYKSSGTTLLFKTLLEYELKAIAAPDPSQSAFWAICGKRFFERKSELVFDFFNMQVIGDCGYSRFIINAAPLCTHHGLFLPYFQEKKPQKVSSAEEIKLCLELLSKTSKPGIKLIFNSEGAGASVLHLHFQIIDLKDLLKGLDTKAPIELRNEREIPELYAGSFFKVFKYKNPAFPLPHFQVKPRDDIKELIKEEAKGKELITKDEINEMSRIVAALAAALNKAEVPYNIMIADNGKSAYIIPRKMVEKQKIGQGTLEMVGIGVISDESFYAATNHKVMKDHLNLFKIDETTLDSIGEIYKINPIL